MPTFGEIRERTENCAQQVRSFASQSLIFVQQKFSAFNDYVLGKSRTDDQNWSTTTSERNLTGIISSKLIVSFN